MTERAMTERAMTESPYAIPIEELEDSARVPFAARVQEQPACFLAADPSGDLLWGDGMCADADGG